MTIGIRPWCARALRSRARLSAAASLALVACTDPTAATDAPLFMTLVPLAEAVRPPDVDDRSRVPADSCPVIGAVASSGRRRRLNAIGASIVLPDNAEEFPRPFGDTPGALFRIPAIGILAVAYDDRIPILQSCSPFFFKPGFREQSLAYRFCPITLTGIPSTLYVDPQSDRVDSSKYIAYGENLALTTRTPSGRRVNFRFVGEPAINGSVAFGPAGARSNRALQLLAAVSTIEWQP